MPESLFKIKLQEAACNFVKKEILTVVFMRILQSFLEHLFYRTPRTATPRLQDLPQYLPLTSFGMKSQFINV